MSPAPDLAELQGNILRGYGFEHVVHLLLHAESGAAARGLLRDLAPDVTSAEEWPGRARPSRTLNLAVTYTGLERLGVPARWLEALPRAFREGPRRRAAALGDVGPSAPAYWESGLGTGEVHLMASVGCRSLDGLDSEEDRLRQLVDRRGGLRVVAAPRGEALRHQREHFGFADGFAQPDVAGAPARRRTAGGGVPLPGGGWRPLRLGEFVLGFPDEDGQTNEGPDPRLMRHGTFVVYRRLQQRVGEFRRMLGEASDLTGLPPELVAAKLVGRWRDGTPLELAPDRVPTDLTDRQAPDLSNDFRYLPHDRVGEMCPRGAHVRRTNPRDSLDFGGVVASGGVLSARHRIIRRGMPYGSPLAPDAEEDDLDRGLLFVCFNADIERQFETVQGDWCSDGDAMGLGEDCDPLAGTGPLRKLTVPVAGGAPAFIPVGRAVVVTRGAEYLLAPSRSALHGLAHRSFA